ncbi:hypothetical protein HRG_009469 [Hirsutella rhossiliensis]|uniref:Uncharacterized protein n=1 Tax=Hirsutella rhossiliensis TaxID=111463 RepID=A0A9P8MQP9_9HYPO|nr:uncharacterized protein HRG_09469 [Hirsutella rhossiliensis]KAH0959687.1 hypothetical protein HRG_09469 [Hirsutella rhossiliensis]
MQMMLRGIEPVFESLFDDRQTELVAPLMQDLPLIQGGQADAAVEAISGLRPLCVDLIAVEYYQQLLGIAHEAARQTMVLLHSHWIALSQVMAFIMDRELDVREKQPAQQDSSMDPSFIRWLECLSARVDGRHAVYNQWPPDGGMLGDWGAALELSQAEGSWQ